MRYWQLYLFILCCSCQSEQDFVPGTYYVYDLLKDSSFYAKETFKTDGTGLFQEIKIQDKDSCLKSQITFNWVFLQNRLVYSSQLFEKIIQCEDKGDSEWMGDQYYHIQEIGSDYFVGKTYYEETNAPLDSSLLLWKRANK